MFFLAENDLCARLKEAELDGIYNMIAATGTF